MKIKFILLFICINIICFSQNKILIIGGTTHVGNGEVVSPSAIVINNNIIEEVLNQKNIKIDTSQYDTIINATNKHIYPGFIIPNSKIGITEIDAVRATRDFKEVGCINPHIRSIIAYNAESKIINTVTVNGVLIGQIVPQGDLITGKSSIVNFKAWNWEDAVLKEDDGIHLNWPQSFINKGWWGHHKDDEKSKNRVYEIMKLKQFFDQALSYYNKENNIVDIKMESMKDLFDDKKTLYIHADYVKDIQDAIIFAKKYNINNIVLVGGDDAIKAKKILKQHNIPVILNRIHSLPSTEDEDIDEFYKLPYELHKNNILFCLGYKGDMDAMGTRNMPFTAGTAHAFGLPKEAAISAISLNAAKILKIDNYVGSIEKGKIATLFISKGDALDIKSNDIVCGLINGEFIELINHQEKLYNKFYKKYNLK
ncbi:MAG: amidohydrolase [Flavobacteriales bacterium]|nr:amidohydrolase [Flavobacteriales bacterium]